MQAVILAGGKGTRLRPFTLRQPKPLLPLLEVPFLAWMVGRCREAGLSSIIMTVGYLGDQIESFFGDGSEWGSEIHYIQETSPLDTAGALVLAQPHYSGEPLLVFNADILTDLDLSHLAAQHQAQQALATLTLTRVADITAYGLVETDETGRIRSFREKPSREEALHITTDTINAGTYILDPGIFAAYPMGQPLSFERRVFPDLLEQGQRLCGYVHEGYWRDLGTPASYYHGQLDILLGKMAAYPLPQVEQPQPGVWIHKSASLDPAAKLQAPVYIGSHSQIGPQAVLAPGTVIGSTCWVNRPLEPGIYAAGTLAV